MNPWTDQLRGKFLVIDGPDGSGKSTQLSRLAALLRENDITVCEVREPGGTLIGEQIRKVLLDPASEPMDPRCEMLLYMASRAQLMSEKIAPALQHGQCVLADRFLSSTLAYQGAAGGLSLDDIRAVGRAGIGDQMPDLTIIFDVDTETASKRLNPLLDRMEQKGAQYHAKVRQGYLDQVQTDPDHYCVIDARHEPDIVFESLIAVLREKFGGNG